MPIFKHVGLERHVSSQLHTDITEYTNSDVSGFFVNKILVLPNLTLIELYK